MYHVQLLPRKLSDRKCSDIYEKIIQGIKVKPVNGDMGTLDGEDVGENGPVNGEAVG